MKTQWYLAIFVILVSTIVIDAQVGPVQTGQALDANYLVGSGGRNTIRYGTDRFDTNLYVTGQVTGGFHFRGHQPYSGADQLSIDLPSAGLDPFIRGSVGIQQVLSGVSYGPSRYLSAERTVLSAGAIAEGLNAPGTSIPRATYLPEMSAKRLYDSAISAYKPTIPDVGQQLLYNPLIQPTLVSSPIPGTSVTSSGVLDSGAARAPASTLFGVLRKPDQKHITDELYEAQVARRTGMVDSRLDSRLKTRVEGKIQPLPEKVEPEKTEETTTPEDKSGQTPPGRQAARPGGPTRPKALEMGQDVFVDMLRTMEKMRTEAEERSRRQGLPEDKQREAKIPLPDEIENLDNPDAVVPATPTESRAVRKVRDTIVIARLAGENRDRFNLNMSHAEKRLAEGEYYAAVGYYDVADILNRGNPLAPLGAGLALFAANEPLSAAYRLRQALKRFPPLMETRVDVQQILDKNLVEIRIGQLEHRLADKDEPVEPALVFLAAFIRASMDQPEKAIQHAETLKKIAGEEKIYQVYADHLIKAASPSTQPASPKGS
ncbi:MAG: hypothetical protein SVV80_12295 [Planctomycetota bacterium]|nr:hypothetical protein [Planctomycetota bacterium]